MPAGPSQVALYCLRALPPSGSRAAPTASLRPAEGKAGHREGKPWAGRLSDPTARAWPHLRLGRRGSGVRDTQLSACGSSNSLTTPTAPQSPAARAGERMEATRARDTRGGQRPPSHETQCPKPAEDLRPRESSDILPQAARARGRGLPITTRRRFRAHPIG